MYKLLSLLFLLPLSSAAIYITGSAPHYKGSKVLLLSESDLISGRTIQVAEAEIDQHGIFQLSYQPETTARYILRIDDISAYLYLQPGIDVTCYYPPPSPAIPVTPGYSHYVGLTCDTTGQELNSLIAHMHRDMDQFVEANYSLIIRKQVREKATAFQTSQFKKHSTTRNAFFKDYLKYRLASLDLIIGIPRKTIFSRHLADQPILYDNPAYISFFTQFYDGYLKKKAITPKTYSIKKRIDEAAPYKTILSELADDPEMANAAFRELVLIHGLFELYYDDDFNAEKVARILTDIGKNSVYPPHRTIAKNILYNSHRLSAGQPAPDFTFKTIDGKTIDQDALKGKPLVIYFWTSGCMDCRQEMQVMKNYEKQYAGQVNFLYVAIDKEVKLQKTIYAGTGLAGMEVAGASSYQLRDKFRIGGVPHIVVLDKEGEFVSGYAPLPSQGLDKTLYYLPK